MNEKVTNCIKRYPFTSALILIIWYLSLFTPPKTQLDHIHFIDKWTHLLMYGTLTGVLWVEYIRAHRSHPHSATALFLYLCPVLMSGIIELVQEYCTVNRSGDWYDFIANATGALIGMIAGSYTGRFFRKK